MWPAEESELHRALFTVVVSTGLTLTVATSVRPILSVAASVALLLAIVHQHVTGISVPDLWPHIAVATILWRSGFSVLNDPHHLVTSSNRALPLVGAGFVVLLIVGTWLNLGFGRMIEIAHLIGYLLGVALMLSAAMGSRTTLDPRLVRFRSVHDPAAVFAIGLVFFGHRHDGQRVGVAMHVVAAELLMLAGVTQAAVCALAQARAVPLLVRAFHAFVWLLNGVWWAHMGYFLYIFPGKRGLHHLLAPQSHLTAMASTVPGVAEKAAFEMTCLYLAVDAEFCALVIACASSWLELSLSRTAAEPGAPSEVEVKEGLLQAARREDVQSMEGASVRVAE